MVKSLQRMELHHAAHMMIIKITLLMFRLCTTDNNMIHTNLMYYLANTLIEFEHLTARREKSELISLDTGFQLQESCLVEI